MLHPIYPWFDRNLNALSKHTIYPRYLAILYAFIQVGYFLVKGFLSHDFRIKASIPKRKYTMSRTHLVNGSGLAAQMIHPSNCLGDVEEHLLIFTLDCPENHYNFPIADLPNLNKESMEKSGVILSKFLLNRYSYNWSSRLGVKVHSIHGCLFLENRNMRSPLGHFLHRDIRGCAWVRVRLSVIFSSISFFPGDPETVFVQKKIKNKLYHLMTLMYFLECTMLNKVRSVVATVINIKLLVLGISEDKLF